ncbi:3-hydroxyacyl-CoA dehydrogenase [Desulfoscipio gibsoniae DSM 7213]|uniref:3-hydroxybutyryl-CoA dehydrogenase n=2 Tax=Desulfoscipio gibsoniae TaxID=102134 RepID=R4KKA1_9FIRM|nr:3-hydroxyacyl-CoA dehydrogenase NAD-binding domain-containing protein [Desulfoscipio gibsoniae]AGL00046.1 3-hydroxyacyl-CoA dehydrogenase [Desulfoscipio gibsoniae DSM 7213]
MEIKSVLVVGAGQMGSGIAQVCVQGGCQVFFYDSNPDAMKKGVAIIDKFLTSSMNKGKYTPEQKQAMMDNIKLIANYEEAKEADLVIEAVVENMAAKQQVHAELDAVMKPEAILSSCTSALPISEMGSVTKRQNKFIGIHFHNPVPVMKIVELIRGLETDDETYQISDKFVRKLNKTPVVVKDVPGFITNRVKIPELVEAIRALSEGIATAEDIDTAFREGFNYPFGPLQLCDFIGLDTLLHIMDDLYANYADTRYFAPPLLRKKVALGHLGRKTGRGIYDYSAK